MKIIGLSGLAGSGKNVCADILAREYGFIVLGMADPIKRIVRDIYHFSEAQLFGESEKRNIIDPRYGFAPRDAIKAYGQMGRELYSNTWIDKAVEVITMLEDDPYAYYTQKRGLYHRYESPGTKGIVISDLRFENEMLKFKSLGAKIVRVVRPGAGLKGKAADHPSEQEQLLLPDEFFDYVLMNDGGIEELERGVMGMMGDLDFGEV